MQTEKCFCHFNGYEVKDAKARKDIDSINQEIDSLSNEVTTTKSSVAAMSSDVTKSKTDIEVIKNNINITNENVSTNTSSIVTNSESIRSVDSKVGVLESLETTDKTNVVSAINEVRTNSNLVSEEVNTLEQKVEGIETNIGAIETNIGAIETLETTDKTNIVSAINEVNSKIETTGGGNSNIYSLEEVVVGTWLGKPLYRKVIDFGYLANKTNKKVDVNIDDLDKFTNIRAIASRSDLAISVPFVNAESSLVISLYISNGQITIENTGSDRSSLYGYVILEYTKTTDSVATSEV